MFKDCIYQKVHKHSILQQKKSPCILVEELEDTLWIIAVCGICWLQYFCRGRFAMGMRGMRTLTGTAACLCTCACLFHLPSFRKRSLVNILEAKSFPLVLVKGLFKRTHTTLLFKLNSVLIVFFE